MVSAFINKGPAITVDVHISHVRIAILVKVGYQRCDPVIFVDNSSLVFHGGEDAAWPLQQEPTRQFKQLTRREVDVVFGNRQVLAAIKVEVSKDRSPGKFKVSHHRLIGGIREFEVAFVFE